MRLPAIKPSTRAELSRRLRLAADHIESHYDQPLPLEALAQVESPTVSTFHFAPYSPGCMASRRMLSGEPATAAAQRLLAEGCTDYTLAERSGFGSRARLYRALTRGAATGGQPPRRRGAALN